MNLQVTALNSGSNGNCYYIGNQNEAILVDAGISCREVEKRLKRLAIDIRKIKAIFISHEHSDHIRGVKVLSKKYQLPVYVTVNTLRNSGLYEENPLFVPLNSNVNVNIGELMVKAFPKNHDAADPHSFIVGFHNLKIGVFTDIGEICQDVITHFKLCNAVFLEANYDEALLEAGPYPYYLKKRIKGKLGHLSNHQAFGLFINHRSYHLTHVFLSHISKENNDPDIIKQLFATNTNGTEIVLTSRERETEIYTIGY